MNNEFPFYKITPFDIDKGIRTRIMKVVEDHKIRLTPAEYNELINEYVDKFIKHVDVPALIQISEFIQNRNKR